MLASAGAVTQPQFEQKYIYQSKPEGKPFAKRTYDLFFLQQLFSQVSLQNETWYATWNVSIKLDSFHHFMSIWEKAQRKRLESGGLFIKTSEVI